jgi:haloalkane dehalogenase
VVSELPFDLAPYRDLYPFENHFFARGRHRMHYVDEGPGADAPPIVMVHGNPTWSFYFRDLIRALRSTHRVVAPDHVGCGLSDKPSDDAYDYRFATRVDDLDALLDHIGVNEKVTLIVHDWGGMIGTAWACRHPERVERLVILNTAAFRLPATTSFPWALAFARSALGGFLIRAFNAFSFGATMTCTTRRLPPLVRAAYRAPYDSWAHRIATQRFVQDIPLSPGEPSWGPVVAVEESLPKLAGKPMLLIWGERDFVFDNHFRDEWVRRFPLARLVSFPDGGHYIMEDATEEIVALVREFVGGPR